MLLPDLPWDLAVPPSTVEAATGGPAGALVWALSFAALGACTFAVCVLRRSRRGAGAIAALEEARAALEAIERGDPPPEIGRVTSGPFDDRLATIGDVARRLAARGRHLSAIIESEPECVKTVAPDGTLIDMNPAGLEMIGADGIEDVRGAPILDLVLPEWREPYREMHGAVLEGESRSLIFEMIGLGGRRLWMETHAVPLRDSEGRTIQLAVTRDITVRKLHETELREARDSAEAASRTKTEFLANMSHELRTPLTAILGYAELLHGDGSSPEEQQRGLRAIHGSANHLLSLISDILDISKIEANRMELESFPCDLAALARDIADSMRAQAAERSTTLEVVVDATLPARVMTDPMRVRQIVVNLVGNAVKFTQDGSVRLELSAAPPAGGAPFGRAEIRVVDTGVGIEADALAQLFTPFTQADTSTTRRFGGTGLGLSISRRLARMLGGDVHATSEAGVGSTFTFTLDLTPETVACEDGASTPRLEQPDVPHPPAPLPSTRHRSGESDPKFDGLVLVVEDNAVNRRVLRKMLERLGLDVEEAENGKVGFEKAMESLTSERPFDLVLLDMHMPVQDGYTTAGLLRNEAFPAPVVALTASAMANDRALCLEAGCDDYASKPVQSVTLRRIVSRYLEAESARQQSPR